MVRFLRRCALVETLFRVGFYGVTYFLGFRENFEVKVSHSDTGMVSVSWVLNLFNLGGPSRRKDLLIRGPR